MQTDLFKCLSTFLLVRVYAHSISTGPELRLALSFDAVFPAAENIRTDDVDDAGINSKDSASI